MSCLNRINSQISKYNTVGENLKLLFVKREAHHYIKHMKRKINIVPSSQQKRKEEHEKEELSLHE